MNRLGWSRDDKFTWLPYQQQPNGVDLIAYNEFYQQKWKDTDVMVDMETGQFAEWTGTKDQFAILQDMYPESDLQLIKRAKRYIEKHIILNDVYMKTEVNPYGLDEYPFTPHVYQFTPEVDSWELKVQSMVRPMIGPQYEANIMRLQMLDILNSQTNSGWVAEQDSVINPRSLFQVSQGKVIWAKKGMLASIQRLEAAQIPQSSFELTSLFDGDLNSVTGMNDSMGGIVESGNESALMMQIKQGAALVSMQDPFDNLRTAKKAMAKKITLFPEHRRGVPEVQIIAKLLAVLDGYQLMLNEKSAAAVTAEQKTKTAVNGGPSNGRVAPSVSKGNTAGAAMDEFNKYKQQAGW